MAEYSPLVTPLNTDQLPAHVSNELDKIKNAINELYQPEPWHEVGATGEPAFAANWSNSSGQETAAFRKDSQNVLRIKGRISKSTNGISSDTVFTLPEGYRPANTVLLRYVTSPWTVGSCGLLHITSNGAVQIFASGLTAGFEVGINTSFYLDN